MERNANRRSLARRQAGRRAVKKGADFEEQVAGVYSLLGAEVVRGVEICQKKVDILATFPLPASQVAHRVIVECKHEKRARDQNQRVMQMKGLVDTARKAGAADSGEIVTATRWGEQARGFAQESGIILLTLQEKISTLIDFVPYMRGLIRNFREGDASNVAQPPLGLYYVSLAGERPSNHEEVETIDSVEKEVLKWASRTNGRQRLAILGGYGTGKTSLCEKLVAQLGVRYLEGRGVGRIPILLRLRDFTKTLSIEALITSFLDQQCGVQNPRFQLFKAMNDAGMLLIILDGLDEMAMRVDADTLEVNLHEIEKLASGPRAKVVLTCRIEHFVTGEEEVTALTPTIQLLPTRQADYEVVRLLPWDDKRINQFLAKRVPLMKEADRPWTYYRDQVKAIPGLADLAHRPVLLDMIAKTLPQLIAGGKPIDRPNLYETYLTGEIQRQKVQKRRALLVPDKARFSLMQSLALQWFSEQEAGLTFSRAKVLVKRAVKPPDHELDAYTRDFLTCSFLAREGNLYHFSHRSILEYLVGRGLAAEIAAKKPKHFLSQPLSRVVATFVVEIGASKEVLWEWIHSSRAATGARTFLAGNAATILCAKDTSALTGRDLSGVVLHAADLRGADLIGTALQGAVFGGCDLRGALLERATCATANLSDSTVSLVMVGRASRRRLSAQRLFEEVRGELLLAFRGGRVANNVPPVMVMEVRIDEKLISVADLPNAGKRVPWVSAAAVFVEELRELDRLGPGVASTVEMLLGVPTPWRVD